jgi:hypothetical protein
MKAALMNYDTKTLHQIGLTLYGPGWVEAVADKLEINLRTVQRWASGQYHIPKGIWNKLAALCLTRIAELQQLAATFAEDGVVPDNGAPDVPHE